MTEATENVVAEQSAAPETPTETIAKPVDPLDPDAWFESLEAGQAANEPEPDEGEPEAPEDDADDESDEPEQDEEEVEAAPKSSRAVEDVKKLRKERRELRDALSQKDADIAALRKRTDEMEAFIAAKFSEEAEPAEKPKSKYEDALDKDYLDEIDGKLTSKEERDFQRTMVFEGKQAVRDYPDYTQAFEFAIVKEAEYVYNQQQSLGEPITAEQAIAAASKKIEQQARKRYEKGLPMADFVYTRAKQLGFKGGADKPAPEKPKVDLDALQEARDTAGTPSVKKGGNPDGASDFWATVDAEIEKEKPRFAFP